MKSIYHYQPITDEHSTQRVELYDSNGVGVVNQIAEIDGLSYIAISDDVDISSVDSALQLTAVSDLSDDLLQQLKAASPRVRYINARLAEQLDNAATPGDDAVALATADEALAELGLPALSSAEKVTAQAPALQKRRQRRQGMLDAVQQSAKQQGMSSQLRDILKYASEALEEWKGDGDLADLQNNLESLTGVTIRAALDKEIPDTGGVTVQQYLLDVLQNG